MKKPAVRIALVTVLAVLMGLASACSSSSPTTATYANQTVTAQVVSISGVQFTLSVGGQGGGPGGAPTDMPSGGANGQRPAMPSGQGSAGNQGGQGGTPPSGQGAPPSGAPADGSGPSGNGSAPGGSGSAPAGSQGGPGGSQATTTLVVTIASSTPVTDSNQTAAVSDIKVGDTVTVVFDASGKVASVAIGVASGGPGGGSGTGSNGTAATTLVSGTYTGASYTSSSADENAARVEAGSQVTLSDATVTKTGDTTSTDNSDFYGQNAGILVLGTMTDTGSTITTNAAGANGILVNGSGNATLTGTTINTSSNNSGGIDATGGGAITATNLNVTTQGGSSAAIRSDRGGGTIKVTGGTFTTGGVGSPVIYSTADISADSAALTSNASEAVVIEGMNSVTLTNSTVSGDMTSSAGGSNENLHSVMIYQSMSGDSTTGQGKFSMTGGTLTSKNGDVFYVTNTSAVITLSGVDIVNEGGGSLFTISGNDSSRNWGTSGSNGGTCEVDASAQTLAGNIVVDSISSLNLTTTDSNFTGTINPDAAAGTVNVTMIGSTWTLTGDAHITSFSGDTSQIVANGHHVYVGNTTLI